ncbi:MAG: DUF3052 domain-containing protein [Burkholderiaceae bacterium]
MPPITAGYSGTPLAGKLGIRPACRLCVLGEAPVDYALWLAPLPPDVVVESQPGASTDIAHLFVTDALVLGEQLAALRRQLKPVAALWVSWPKKAAKVPTTVTEDTVRELALPLGWVDIKVCAVNDVWSGLKLVVRKNLRPGLR